jgi:hypothetical protein
MKEAVSAKALEEWIKEFFGIVSADVHSVHIDPEGVTISVLPRDADGNRVLVGPQAARQQKKVTQQVSLLKPGRPEGTTVANGAKPKTKRAPAPEIMHGGGSD